jgi:hypothetical protein
MKPADQLRNHQPESQGRTMNDINPREFGRLEAEVHSLRTQVTDLQKDMRELLELANRSKGGLWVGMGIAALAGSVVSWIVGHLFTK